MDMESEKSSKASTSTLGSIPRAALPARKPLPQQKVTMKPDIVLVKNIQLTVVAGHTSWGGMLPQIVHVTARIQRSTARAAETDSIDDALNYQTIYHAVLDMTGEAYSFKEDFVRDAVKRIVNATGEKNGDIEVKFPRGMLRAEEGGLVMKARFGLKAENDVEMIIHTVELENTRVTCIIGIDPAERQFKQPIIMNLSITREDHALKEYSISNALAVFLRVCIQYGT
jgi:dihydroneopterin aldolase